MTAPAQYGLSAHPLESPYFRTTYFDLVAKLDEVLQQILYAEQKSQADEIASLRSWKENVTARFQDIATVTVGTAAPEPQDGTLSMFQTFWSNCITFAWSRLNDKPSTKNTLEELGHVDSSSIINSPDYGCANHVDRSIPPTDFDSMDLERVSTNDCRGGKRIAEVDEMATNSLGLEAAQVGKNCEEISRGWDVGEQVGQGSNKRKKN